MFATNNNICILNLKKIFVAILCIVAFNQDLDAQTDPLKKGIGLYYSMAFTKVDFNGYYWGRWPEPTRGLYGSSIGINYQLPISTTSSISFGGFITSKGAKSKPYEVNNPENPNTKNFYYFEKHKVISFEIPVLYHHQILKHEKYAIMAIGGLAPDIYLYYTGKNYYIRKTNNKTERGNTTRGGALLFETFKIGSIAGVELDLKIHEEYRINIMPQLGYYIELMKNSWAPQGNTFAASLFIGVRKAF